FGNIRPGVVAGSVFDDLDRDGARDPGEGGLGGWTVMLDRVETTTRALDRLRAPSAFSQALGRDLSNTIAFLGDRILVGSIYDDTGAVDSGVVHVYDRASGELLDTWANPNPDLQDQFGAEITVMGENVLVSTKNSAYRGNSVYLLDGATGDVLQQFDLPAGVYDRYFGETVVAWGNTVIISAPGGDGRVDGGSIRGGVVFFFDAASGELIREIQSPDPDRYDNFGGAMAVVGDRLLVGSWGNDTVILNSGTVFLFDTATGELLNEFNDSDPTQEARLGRTITALGEDFLVSSSQQLYVLDGETGELLRTFDNPGRGWRAGTSVTTVGNNILVGSPDDNYSMDKAAWLGRAYLLDGMRGELLRSFENPDADAGKNFGQFVASDGEMIIISHHSLLADPDITQAYIYDADTFTVQTDAEGNYRFDGVKPGTYRVRAIANGDYELSMPEGNGDYQAIVVSGYVEDGFDFGGVAIENWAAEAAGDSYALEENTPLTVTDVAGVLANDVDRDGDALTAVLVSGPQHGVLTLSADGSFVYTSEEGFHGLDGFTYRADDGSLTSNLAEVTLFVEVVHSGSAEGLVFEDTNQNGVQDEGELGLADWIVELERIDGPLELMQTYSRPLAPFWATDAGSVSSVAFVGEDVLVGVERDDSSGSDAGAVYRYDATTGQHIQTYLNPEGRWTRFGLSVAAIGDDVLVGSQNAAYLFDGGTGELLHKFASPVAYSWSFGWNVAAIGDNVLIAAPYAPSSEVNLAGAVYLFDGDTYELLQTFHSPDPDAYDQFGRSIAAVGNNVLIGANGDDTQRANGGVSYLYDGATGELLRTFVDSGGYGHAVAAAGENVLVGDSNGVSLFDGATGELLQTYVSPSSYTWSFGQALAAIDGKVLIGAPQARAGNTWGSGVLYVYDMESGDLLQTLSSPEMETRGHFGGSLDVSGDRVVVGQDSHWTGESMVQAYSFHIDRFVVSTTTDAEGNYDFSGLRPGTYEIRQTPQDGFLQTSPLGNGMHTIHVAEDGTVSGLDFGNMRLVAPEARDDQYAIDQDTELTVIPDGVLSNDTDANGDPLLALLVDDVQHGELVLGNDGSLTYTPDDGYYGTDTFTYRAHDGGLHSEIATVTITVNRTFTAPDVEDDHYTTEENTTLAIAAAGILANDSDADGDSLSAVLVDGPAHGQLDLAADGSFVYTPDDGFLGVDRFTYRATDGQVASDLAEVTIGVAHDLGGIHVIEMPHLNPSEGDIWYSFLTTRDALITLWAQNSDDVTITLYDESLDEVAVWTPGNGHNRIEWPAEEGQRYYFSLSGVDDDVNVHLANVLRMNNGRATLFGSQGDDVFELDADDLARVSRDYQSGADANSDPIVITINGVDYIINPGEITSFEIDGDEGHDRVIIRGSVGDDVVRMLPNAATVVGPGYRVDVVNTAEITVFGNGGNDRAYFYDSAGNDRFYGKETVSWLTGDGFTNTVRDFDRVDAYATAGGNDRAFLYDSAGNDRFYGRQTMSWITGEGFLNVARSFDQVNAYATAGGDDRAYLYDSALNDFLEASGSYATMHLAESCISAFSFARVYAFSIAGGQDASNVIGVLDFILAMEGDYWADD
ncbi:MAG: Ig-like domain-containing protein, partial [Thermoguttaceae bacterium]